MPIPSCQTILIRSPLTPLKTYKSPACGSRPSTCCTCNASPFMPFLISVRPTASHTRTPLGTGIIAAPARPTLAQRRSVNVAINANPAPARQLDLDQPRFLALPAARRVTDRGRLAFANHGWQRRDILGDLDRYERGQFGGARHADNPELGQPAPLVHLGRHQPVPTRDLRHIGSRRHRLRQHRQLLLDTEPATPLHAPQQLGSRVRHRSCAIASSSSKPASRILTPPSARRPSPQGYDNTTMPLMLNQAGRRCSYRAYALCPE